MKEELFVFEVNFSSKIQGLSFISKGPMPFLARLLYTYNPEVTTEQELFETLDLMKLWIDERWHNNTLLHCDHYFPSLQCATRDLFDISKRKPQTKYKPFIDAVFNKRIPYLCAVEPSCLNMAKQLFYYANQMDILGAKLHNVSVMRKHDYVNIISHASEPQPIPVFNPS